jgi:hypothetical protein
MIFLNAATLTALLRKIKSLGGIEDMKKSVSEKTNKKEV